MNNYTLHTPDLRTYEISGDTPHAALKQFCDDILTDAPTEKTLMPNGEGEWLVYMYVAPQWKGTHRIVLSQPDPETAYCANCKQVQLLEGYDDEEVRAAMGDVKQCVACGHIVDSERTQ